MRLPVTAASLAEKAAGTKRLSSVLRVHHRRWYSKRNLLELRERAGFVHDIFPPHSHQKFIEHLTGVKILNEQYTLLFLKYPTTFFSNGLENN